MRKSTKSSILFLIFLAILFFKLETYHAVKGNFAFAYDQGRDLLEAAKIAFEGNLTLIGPTTGLPGIFYGPWWYYFLAILVFISGGNPTFVAIVFSFLGFLTILTLFFFLLSLTRSFLISIFFSYISLVSKMWMLAPTLIWSPTLVPISMILLFFSFLKTVNTQKIQYFFLYGLASQLILNGEVAYGVMVTLWQVMSVLVFRKSLLNVRLFYAVFGIFVAWVPQILFEFKNNFLETRAVISYINEPKVYGEHFGIFTRFVQRLNTATELVSQSYFSANKTFAILFLLYIILSSIFVYKNIKNRSIKALVSYIGMFLLFSLGFFTLFQDRVWDYYLIGIPITITIYTALIFYETLKTKYLKFITYAFFITIFLSNIPLSIFESFDEKRAIDGGAYLNAKRVMDYITSQKPTEYSYYVFSPAIFDPPFDYLFYWYQRQGLIEEPKNGKDTFYLIIREYSSNKYSTGGWYGDKTKDRSQILEKKDFIGDFVLEKHTFNE